MHFDALRLVALREGGRIEETLATENEREKYLYAHLRTYTQPTQLFAAGACLQPTPSPLCLVFCSMYLGSNYGLDLNYFQHTPEPVAQIPFTSHR